MPHTEPTPETPIETRTYSNPVYKGYFADPFVWEYQGIHYALRTGAVEAEGQVDEIADAVHGDRSPDKMRVFPILRFDDFLPWNFAGNVLRPDPAFENNFWALEAAYCDGKFYLYYSVGHEAKNHQLRVAVSDRPLELYQDAGESLLDPSDYPLAIKPHPFRDQDGQWYLFHARDFLDTKGGVRADTVLIIYRLEGMTKLASIGKVVLRARRDWQRFLGNHPMYGSIYNWHTLKGPCVRRYAGRYYCFYSSGRWEVENYGVDYGVTDSVGPYSDAGNEAGPHVLRSVPGCVLNPLLTTQSFSVRRLRLSTLFTMPGTRTWRHGRCSWTNSFGHRMGRAA